MASAQVLPSSRKQEHLEAGKRRLEEFRKKKAAERAKKVATTSQPDTSDASLEKQPSETEHSRITDSDGAGTSDGTSGPVGVFNNNGKSTIDFTKKVERSSLKDADANLPSASDDSTSIADLVQRRTNNHDFTGYNTSGFIGAADVSYGQGMDKMISDSRMYTGTEGGIGYGISSDHSITRRQKSIEGFDSNSSQSILHEKTLFPSENNGSLKDSALISDGSHAFYSPISANSQLQTKPSSATTVTTGADSVQSFANLRGSSLDIEHAKRSSLLFIDHMNSNFAERNFSSLSSGHGAALHTYESTGSSSDVRSSSSYGTSYKAASDTSSRRSRPSFLDSLNVSIASSGTSFQHTQPERESYVGNHSKSNGMDDLGSSTFQKSSVETEPMGPFAKLRPSDSPPGVDNSLKFSISSSNGVDLLKSNENENENTMERKREFYSSKENEDFAALEQHIEDLTQEKFSLQRALEASRVLAESLAAENSSLTDGYNQQQSVVNQLKSDMEMLQEEIKAHLVELESVKIECANAQLECHAADERAKLLASEVIGLEEKALKLRSSELKLERQLENSHSELTLYKKKMSSLEKDRQDLQSTIDALQEDKKLLQSKLWKASANGKSSDASRNLTDKKDMSTSTDDLDAIPDASNLETPDTGSPSTSDARENGQLNLEAFSIYIPSDQARMLHNINSLISELALEKEELMQTLASEASQCSKLKALNNELSRKLESQTQRLELLTAQSVANGNILVRSHDSKYSTTYADEGDEVVERVLGWIMKLFPGGPSRRRTSKLL